MIEVYVSTKDRKEITEKCLNRLKEICDSNQYILTIVDDDSTEYDLDWLRQFTPCVHSAENPKGLTPQMRLLNTIRLQLGLFKLSNEPYCYLTDNDCYHHLNALEVALDLVKHGEPVGLYISKYNLENRLETPFYKLNSGVSLFFSRFDRFYPFAQKELKKNLKKWDGTLFRAYRDTGGKFALPEYSMLEHIGEGGVNFKKGNPDVAQFLHPELKRELYGS
jgi:hypothetical protein